MKKKINRKLVLNRNTMAGLNGVHIVGGNLQDSFGCTMDPTCSLWMNCWEQWTVFDCGGEGGGTDVTCSCPTQCDSCGGTCVTCHCPNTNAGKACGITIDPSCYCF